MDEMEIMAAADEVATVAEEEVETQAVEETEEGGFLDWEGLGHYTNWLKKYFVWGPGNLQDKPSAITSGQDIGYTNAKLGQSINGNSGTTGSGAFCTVSGVACKTGGYNGAHAEGVQTEVASATGGHAEGYETTASKGDGAHAEGSKTTAEGTGAHAEGSETKALHFGSHAEGVGTITGCQGQHVSGRYNKTDTTSMFVVGCGSSDSVRANCLAAGADSVGSYLKLGSGGRIATSGLGVSWWQGRDGAIVRNNGAIVAQSFYPILSSNTINGSWDVGIVDDHLHFSYVTNKQYNDKDSKLYSKCYIDTNGVFNGTVTNANQATKLATPRTIQVNLESSSATSFNGTQNIQPGITGQLPVKNGGTNADNPQDARKNLGLQVLEIAGDNLSIAASGTGSSTYNLGFSTSFCIGTIVGVSTSTTFSSTSLFNGTGLTAAKIAGANVYITHKAGDTSINIIQAVTPGTKIYYKVKLLYIE